MHRKWKIEGAREGAAIEIYRNAERYITITGVQIGECKELAPLDVLDKIRTRYDFGTKGFDFNAAVLTALTALTARSIGTTLSRTARQPVAMPVRSSIVSSVISAVMAYRSTPSSMSFHDGQTESVSDTPVA